VADGPDGFQILDLSNLANPVRLGGVVTSNAQRVAISGNYAYVADSLNALKVIDFSSPTNPILTNAVITANPVGRVAVSSNLVFVAEENEFNSYVGLEIFDISDPVNPLRTSSYRVTNPPQTQEAHAGGIAVRNNYVYFGYGGVQLSSSEQGGSMGFGGIDVLDISNPSIPVRAGGIATSDRYFGLTIASNYLYGAYGYTPYSPPPPNAPNPVSGGIKIFNISNPTTLSQVWSYQTNAFASDVAVSGTNAFLSGSNPRLQIFDISNPASGTKIAGYDTTGQGLGIAASGNYAFMADGDQGLQIVWVSPSQPIRLTAQRGLNQIKLSWPVSASGYLLESKTNLSAGAWQTVSGTPTVPIQGESYIQFVPSTAPSSFFRLRHP
jgi:hypothetical protein